VIDALTRVAGRTYRVRKLLPVLFVATIVIAGCGGDDDDDDVGTTDAPTTEVDAETTSSSVGADGNEVDDAQALADDAALTLEDLPAGYGWRVQPEVDDPDGDAIDACLDEASAEMDRDSLAEAEAPTFADSDDASTAFAFSNVATVYEDTSTAERAVAALDIDVTAQCIFDGIRAAGEREGFDIGDEDVLHHTGPESWFPETIGDASDVWTVSMTLSAGDTSLSVFYDLAIVRVDRVVTSVVFANPVLDQEKAILEVMADQARAALTEA
jgi:hypothetical protein